MLVFSLVFVGLVVQASISDFRGRAIAGDPTHFILQQALYFVAGLICCFVIAAIHPEFWFRREVAAVVLLGILVAVGEHLCLVQIFDGEREVIIDPFRFTRGEGLKELFEKPGLSKAVPARPRRPGWWRRSSRTDPPWPRQ